MDAFYGGNHNEISGVLEFDEETPDKCEPCLVRKMINKAHKFADALIAEDEELDGTIDNLSVRDEPISDKALNEEEEDILNDDDACIDQTDTFFAGINPLDDDETAGKEPCSSDEDDPDILIGDFKDRLRFLSCTKYILQHARLNGADSCSIS